MVANERDLWPQDLTSQVSNLRTPLALLREQAALLGEKTNNIVEAKVATHTSDTPILDALKLLSGPLAQKNGQNFIQYFNLVSPALGNYTYQLFRVVHPIQGYPLKVDFGDQEVEADSEEEFITILKNIFASEKTKRVVQAMMAQSMA